MGIAIFSVLIFGILFVLLFYSSLRGFSEAFCIFSLFFLEIQLEKYNFRMLFVEIQLGRLSEASQTDFSTLNLNLSPLDGIDSPDLWTRGPRGPELRIVLLQESVPPKMHRIFRFTLTLPRS